MLWHTGLALLPDGRSMRNDFTSGTIMVLSTEHVMTLAYKWRVDNISSFLPLMMSQFSDSCKTHWVASTSKPTPLPKGDGQSIMVSDFLTSEWGRLCDHDEQLDLFESVSHSLMVAYLSY